jgi:hypothetical protein
LIKKLNEMDDNYFKKELKFLKWNNKRIK